MAACGYRFESSRFLVTRGCRYWVTDAGSPHRHGTRIGRVTGYLAVILRHVDVRWKNDNETTPGLRRRNSAEH